MNANDNSPSAEARAVAFAMLDGLQSRLTQVTDPKTALDLVMGTLLEHEVATGMAIPSRLFEGTPVSYADFVAAVRREPLLFSVQMAQNVESGLYMLVLGLNVALVRETAVAVAESMGADNRERCTAVSQGRDYFGPGTLGPLREPVFHAMGVMGTIVRDGPITVDDFIFRLQFAGALILGDTAIDAVGGIEAVENLVESHLASAVCAFHRDDMPDKSMLSMVVARDPSFLKQGFMTLASVHPPLPCWEKAFQELLEDLDRNTEDWRALEAHNQWENIYFAPEAKRVLN